MRINIITIGTLKEKYLVEGCNEYIKRISRYHNISLIEIPESKLPKNFSDSDINKCLLEEAFKISSHLKGFVVVLCIEGNQLDSVSFAKKIENIAINYDTVTFVIGSSYGIDDSIKNKANMLLSFSKMTFPHQLFREMLLEQIYRATTITNNIQYHK